MQCPRYEGPAIRSFDFAQSHGMPGRKPRFVGIIQEASSLGSDSPHFDDSSSGSRQLELIERADNSKKTTWQGHYLQLVEMDNRIQCKNWFEICE